MAHSTSTQAKARLPARLLTELVASFQALKLTQNLQGWGSGERGGWRRE